MAYTESDYRRDRATCDKAAAYWKANATFTRGGWSSMSPELAAHPAYAAATPETWDRVETFELRRDKPESFVAYVGPDGSTLQTWRGTWLGVVRLGCSWPVRSHFGPRMYQAEVRAFGRTYTGRTFGKGMAIRLRETAASKRARAAKGEA